jgi:hypothetical protein
MVGSVVVVAVPIPIDRQLQEALLDVSQLLHNPSGAVGGAIQGLVVHVHHVAV